MSRHISRRHLMARAAVLGVFPLPPRAMAAETASPQLPAHSLAQRLALYADGVRFDDLDAATIERVKAHVIDTIGCGIGAFDEKPVRVCRDVALAVPGHATIIGTNRRTTTD